MRRHKLLVKFDKDCLILQSLGNQFNAAAQAGDKDQLEKVTGELEKHIKLLFLSLGVLAKKAGMSQKEIAAAVTEGLSPDWAQKEIKRASGN